MERAVKYYTHVNRHVIDANRRDGTNHPAIAIKRGKTGRSEYANEVELPPGSRMIYSPHEPLLACGARLVIVSDTKPTVL